MNLAQLTIEQAHQGLIEKKFSCRSLLEYCLERIEKYDSEINAFVSVNKEAALKKADQIDKKISQGELIGLLEGIPYSVKEAILTQDIKTTSSSNMLKNFTAPYSATVISKLEKSGAIMIGKTNCDAYGHGSSTENSDFFTTRNPWDKQRVAGGSSGGSAASVAAGMCLFSIGEDTGGSIRQPASFCGVTGLKVSYGRVSRYGCIAYASSLDTIGPFAKTAEDCATVLQVIAGIDEKDHTTVDQPVSDYGSNLNDFSLANKVIGLPKEFFTEALDSGVNDLIQSSIEKLKIQGVQFKEISLPHTEYCIASYYLIATAETSSNLSRLDGIRYGHRSDEYNNLTELYQNSRSEGFGPEVKRRIMLGTFALSAGYYDAYYKKAQQVRTLIIQDFEKAFQEVDFILSPTSPFPAFKVGEKSNDPLSMYLADIYTIGFSLAGIPTISVPVGFSNGLPVGMQLTAPSFKEQEILNLAHCFQKLTDFHQKYPQL